jgi:transmembrane sensor
MARETRVDPSIAGDAADWWARLHDEGVSPEDQRHFAMWVARSPERIEAYLDVARLMRALKSGCIRLPDTPVDELIRAAKAASGDPLPMPAIGRQSERVHSMSDEVADIPSSPKRLLEQRTWNQAYRRYGWALAASLLLAVAGAWVLHQKPQEYATTFGEQRSILLSDGSRVTLNTGSRIEVDYQKNRRVVRLLEGEALFDVAHDRIRPFDVVARSAVFRAVGTEFNVDMQPKATTITVVEGRVAVMGETEARIPINADPSIENLEHMADSAVAKRLATRPFPAPPGSLILAADEKVVVTAAGPGIAQHVSNVMGTTSWIEHQLVFDHAPLSDVVEQFNRYNHDRIRVEGADLANKKKTGVFQLNDPGSFLKFLSGIRGVQVQTISRDSHLVTASPQSVPPAH